jgi:hypothetical protein
MQRAVGFFVFVSLIVGTLWVGLALAPTPSPADATSERFMATVPDVTGMRVQDATQALNDMAIEVETVSSGHVTRVFPGTYDGIPAFVVIEGTRPGQHRCPSFFNSCPLLGLKG